MAGTSEEKWSFYLNVEEALNSLPLFISPKAKISRSAEYVGQVVIESGAQVLPGAFVEGPAYIGRGSFIGNGALIRPGSFVSRGAIVGFQCYCTAAILGPKAGAFHFCGVSRSLLEKNCRFTAFVITGTARPNFKPILAHFPNEAGLHPVKRGCIVGENTFIGSHVIINPGVTIASNCYVGPHVNVSADLESNSRLRLRAQVEKTDNKLIVAEIPSAPAVDFGLAGLSDSNLEEED